MINRSTFPKEYHCKLCYDIFKNPILSQCGHSFCHSCIDINYNSEFICPQCLFRSNKSDLTQNFKLMKDIEELNNFHSKFKKTKSVKGYKYKTVYPSNISSEILDRSSPLKFRNKRKYDECLKPTVSKLKLHSINLDNLNSENNINNVNEFSIKDKLYKN